MTSISGLALRSAWSRRHVLSWVVVSIALSTFLLLSLDRLRQDARTTFMQAVSGTDLIVGARTGSVQLLLYAVFHVGSAGRNVRVSSLQSLAEHRSVDWVVPLSLGDSVQGHPVLGTTPDYFTRFRHGRSQALAWAQGRAFSPQPGAREAVLGAEAARRLQLGVGQTLVVSHGDGALADNDHDAHPFRVVGVLQPTGTPVDRTVHVDMGALDEVHHGEPVLGGMPEVPSATAALVGLKRRTAVFSVQRWVNEFADEPLMAVLPAVALDELWELVGVGEKGLWITSVLVSVVSLLGLVAVISAGLNERRRELAVLRSVGAAPRHVLGLLALEGVAVTVCGMGLGLALAVVSWVSLQSWMQQNWGIRLAWNEFGVSQAILLGLVMCGGLIASLWPAWRAYRLSLVDGLSPRV